MGWVSSRETQCFTRSFQLLVKSFQVPERKERTPERGSGVERRKQKLAKQASGDKGPRMRSPQSRYSHEDREPEDWFPVRRMSEPLQGESELARQAGA